MRFAWPARPGINLRSHGVRYRNGRIQSLRYRRLFTPARGLCSAANSLISVLASPLEHRRRSSTNTSGNRLPWVNLLFRTETQAQSAALSVLLLVLPRGLFHWLISRKYRPCQFRRSIVYCMSDIENTGVTTIFPCRCHRDSLVVLRIICKVAVRR